MKSIILTAESSYARFRRPYTTTSALTYLSIHPLAVKGLIGAVMGIEYDKIYDYTMNMKIAIQVLNPVIKDMQSFNLIAQTNNNEAQNFQSRIEFLRDVKYRLFISENDDKLKNISIKLKNNNYVFTPYLGCSEHIARLKYEGIYDSIPVSDNFVDTVIPKEYVDFDSSMNFHIYVERLPIKNNRQREYTEYSNTVFAVEDRIKTKGDKISKVGDYNVFFF